MPGVVPGMSSKGGSGASLFRFSQICPALPLPVREVRDFFMMDGADFHPDINIFIKDQKNKPNK